MSRPTRTSMAELIATSAPAQPACFPSAADWRLWLAAAHESGVRVVRRVDLGKSRGDRHTHYEMLPTEQIDYCSDCSAGYQNAMRAIGKCVMTKAVRTKEPADAA